MKHRAKMTVRIINTKKENTDKRSAFLPFYNTTTYLKVLTNGHFHGFYANFFISHKISHEYVMMKKRVSHHLC